MLRVSDSTLASKYKSEVEYNIVIINNLNYKMFLQEFSESLNLSNKKKLSKSKRKPNLNIDRILLGPLTKDTIFLKNLVNNPKLIMKKKNMFGELVQDECQDEVRKFVEKK